MKKHTSKARPLSITVANIAHVLGCLTLGCASTNGDFGEMSAPNLPSSILDLGYCDAASGESARCQSNDPVCVDFRNGTTTDLNSLRGLSINSLGCWSIGGALNLIFQNQGLCEFAVQSNYPILPYNELAKTNNVYRFSVWHRYSFPPSDWTLSGPTPKYGTLGIVINSKDTQQAPIMIPISIFTGSTNNVVIQSDVIVNQKDLVNLCRNPSCQNESFSFFVGPAVPMLTSDVTWSIETISLTQIQPPG